MSVIGQDDGILRFVYSCFPTVVQRYDEVANIVNSAKMVPAPPIARQFSGGSQVIPFDAGHLCLVHEAVTLDDESPAYIHRWVWFDRDWRLTKLSPPFVFLEARGRVRRGPGAARRRPDHLLRAEVSRGLPGDGSGRGCARPDRFTACPL